MNSIYVYDAMGKLVSEYETNTLGSETGIRYVTADALGSTRVVTDGSKVVKTRGAAALAVKARYDYLPFGEEIRSSVGGRSSIPGYETSDRTRQKFTSKERDIETGLDYFGARYYASVAGRFTSCDPVNLTKRHIVNPQRWNLYVYVNNNPLALVDPDGRDPQGKEGSKTIDIFIAVTRKELRGNKMPDWAGLVRIGKENGYDIKVHSFKDSKVGNVESSLKNSAATIIVGHALYDSHDKDPNHRWGVQLNGGALTDMGVAKDSGKNDIEMTGGKPQARGELLAIIGCNSANMSPVVEPTHDDYQLVVNDSGKDGETESQGALNAAHDFTEGYVQGGVSEGIDDANRALKNAGRKFPEDRGDQLILRKQNKDGTIVQ